MLKRVEKVSKGSPKKYFKRILAGITLTTSGIFSTNILAANANFEAPLQCAYGRYQGDVPLDGLESALQAGLDYYSDSGVLNQANMWFQVANLVYGVFENYDYLRVEIPKYVIQNESFRAKGNLFDRYAYVRFHNSELGFIGKDKSNLDANAYFNMKFPKTYGLGLVWITRADNTQCSMETVYVQKKPSISKYEVDTGYGRLDVDVSYLVDKYSKASKDANTKVRVSVLATSDLFGTPTSSSKMFTSRSGTERITVYPTTGGGGGYTVSVTVHDGTYSVTQRSTRLYHVPGEPKPPCDRCVPR